MTFHRYCSIPKLHTTKPIACTYVHNTYIHVYTKQCTYIYMYNRSTSHWNTITLHLITRHITIQCNVVALTAYTYVYSTIPTIFLSICYSTLNIVHCVCTYMYIADILVCVLAGFRRWRCYGDPPIVTTCCFHVNTRRHDYTCTHIHVCVVMYSVCTSRQYSDNYRLDRVQTLRKTVHDFV